MYLWLLWIDPQPPEGRIGLFIKVSICLFQIYIDSHNLRSAHVTGQMGLLHPQHLSNRYPVN